jgi:hypothetical protein
MITRRDFGRTALAVIPVWEARKACAAANAVRLGVATYSFRDLIRTPGRDNVDDLVKALQWVGAKEVELSAANTEPAGPNRGPAVPPPPSVYPLPIKAPSSEEVAAAQLAVRNALRTWRLATPDAHYESVRAKFQAAGIGVFSYRVDYDRSFTGEEIEVTFHQAETLGVG